MKRYKIYVLIDPKTKKIRYVGRTVQTLKNRLKKHLRAKDKSHRVNWIQSLLKEGLNPEIKLLCETISFDECKELEKYYINRLQKEGCDLVNMTEGGDGSIGFSHSNDTKEKLSKITSKRMSDNKVIENLKNKGIERWKNTSEEDKLKMIMRQPHRRSIGQYSLDGELIKEFNSLREIERVLGYFRANISPCLRGEFKQAYGFIWKYLD